MSDIFHLQDLDPRIIAVERVRVFDLLQDLALPGSVMEVGSTAVAGAIGKQDIDFMVRVHRNDFMKVRDILDQNFRRNPDQLSNNEFQGYRVESSLDVSIQLLIAESGYDVFEDFLKILKSDPALVQSYNDLKRRWDGKSMEEYRDAKSRFIELALAGKQ